MPRAQKITYEDKVAVIDQELQKRKHKWHLNAIAWFDFQDVEQIIRFHIFKKWHLWDQKRPLEPWVNKIISNQLKNILRNNYSNFARPCLSCPFNQSEQEESTNGNLCGFTPSGLQCGECKLYAKWEKGKKHAYDIKLPLALENHHQEVFSIASREFDMGGSISKLHIEMKVLLSEKHYEIYEDLFIKNLSEDQVAKKLGYTTNEKNRKAGYKQIKNLKKMFKEKAVVVIQQKDIIVTNE
jgi:hypothetical protein